MKALLPFVMLAVNWTVDTNDKHNQKIILYVFAAVHTALFLCMAYLFSRIWFSSTEGEVVVTIQAFDPKDKGKTEKISIKEYDSRKFRELCVQKIVIPLGIMTFLYSKWGVILPLIFQCVNNPVQLFNSELFQIHVLRKAPQFDLARPWTEPNPMPEWLTKLTGAGGAEESDKKKKKK